MTIEHEALPHDLYDLYPRAGHEVVHLDTGRPYWPHYYHHGRNGRGGLTTRTTGRSSRSSPSWRARSLR